MEGKTLCWISYFCCTEFVDNFRDEYFLLTSGSGPELMLRVLMIFNASEIRMSLKKKVNSVKLQATAFLKCY